MSLALVLLLVGPTLAAEGQDPKAMLKRMSDYLAAQETVEIMFDSAIEVITPTLEKLQFTNSGGALLARPNRLYAHRVGGYTDVALYFDGATVGIYSEESHAYAQFKGPSTVDGLITMLREGHGIAFPGADLLLSNPYEVLIADVLEAKYIGKGVVNGYRCEHLAFRNFDTDWQLWIREGDQPIPCRLVITSKTINSAPQYTLHVTGWNSAGNANDRNFSFEPPADARMLGPDQLIEFDELPPSAVGGGGQ